MEQAFADLRGLMALAGDMVQLAERFREALAERARTGEASSKEDHMDASMEADLISMGIASPVTKATSGALYHRELSRQVSALTPLVPAMLPSHQSVHDAGPEWHGLHAVQCPWHSAVLSPSALHDVLLLRQNAVD